MEFTFNGAKVRYANGGHEHDPSQPSVMLIHGSGMNRTVWQMQTRYLAHHGFRVVAVDLPGHGGSDGPPIAEIEAMGGWVVDLVDAMELGPTHLVGHSMGTYIALEAASQRPEAIASLVLVGTAASMPVHPELLDAAANDLGHASNLMSSWGFGAPAHIGSHATPGMWLIGGSRALLDVSRPQSLAVDMQACNQYQGAVQAADAVSCPTTFVLGSLDKMTPNKKAADLVAAVSGSRVVKLDGVGHMMPIEAPDQTRDAIVEALSLASA